MRIKINLNGHDFIGEYKQNQKALNFGAYSVEDFYFRPSTAKVEAEKDILRNMGNFGGYDYYVTGGNTCTFSAVWFVEIDGEEFQIRETASNRYIEGPKTKTIAEAIEEKRRENRRQKRAAIEYNTKRTAEVEKFREFISETYEEIKDIIADNYKDLYNILESEAFAYCENLEIIKPWYAEAAEILNQYKTEK